MRRSPFSSVTWFLFFLKNKSIRSFSFDELNSSMFSTQLNRVNQINKMLFYFKWYFFFISIINSYSLIIIVAVFNFYHLRSSRFSIIMIFEQQNSRTTEFSNSRIFEQQNSRTAEFLNNKIFDFQSFRWSHDVHAFYLSSIVNSKHLAWTTALF